MAKPIARRGDPGSHDGHTPTGFILNGSTDSNSDGKEIARQGDSYTCSVSGHGNTALTASIQSTTVDGKAIIRVGDHAGCGAIIISGSPTTTS